MLNWVFLVLQSTVRVFIYSLLSSLTKSSFCTFQKRQVKTWRPYHNIPLPRVLNCTTCSPSLARPLVPATSFCSASVSLPASYLLYRILQLFLLLLFMVFLFPGLKCLRIFLAVILTCHLTCLAVPLGFLLGNSFLEDKPLNPAFRSFILLSSNTVSNTANSKLVQFTSSTLFCLNCNFRFFSPQSSLKIVEDTNPA